ncbi:MAG: hypothetical protein LUG47_06185 [Clostridiales bacterium]|nr:hypothetical protein [Clostridiales bacterium]
MGFKIKKELIADNNGFRPIDLNDRNVQKIFERCLADTNTAEKEGTFLFPQALGYSKEDEKFVFFDKVKLDKDEKSILFLYGQIASSHQNDLITPPITSKSSSQKYTGEVWTRNNGIIMEFLLLGRAIGIVSPFNKKTQDAAFVSPHPTLSPNDPKFPEWWAKHKIAWEDRKR